MFESVFVIVFSPPSEFHAILICAFRLASATPVIDYFESMHQAMTFLAFQFVSLKSLQHRKNIYKLSSNCHTHFSSINFLINVIKIFLWQIFDD